MKMATEKFTEVCCVSVVGFILLGIVCFSPNGGGHAAGSFLQVARATSWGNLLDWAAAWCSLKVILLSASLFLLIDSFGTLLLVLNYRHLAGKIFILIILPFMGFFIGTYYLVKSLL